MIFRPLFAILLMAVVVLLVIVVVAILLVRFLAGSWQVRPSSESVAPGQTPLDILKERYARGEIDREEFEERRRVLGE